MGAHRGHTRWRRVFVLLCASFVPFGAHYLKHSLGPLKPFLASGEPDAPFTSTEFGTFLAAVSWPNLLFPFVAGAIVDEKGHTFSAVFFTSLALLGHLAFCIFVLPPLRSFFPALAGRIVYGAGEGGTGIVQGAIIGTWFEEDTMAFSIGFTESVHYMANWVGKAVPAWFAENKSVAGALWIGNGFLFASVVVAFIYLFYESTFHPFRFALGRVEVEEPLEGRRRSESAVSWYGAVRLPSPSGPQGISTGALDWSGALGATPSGDDLFDAADEEASAEVAEAEAALPKDNGSHHSRSPEPLSWIDDGSDDPRPRGVHFYLSMQAERVRTLPAAFWLVGVLHFIFSNLHNLFGGISSDMIRENARLSPAQAGFVASLDSLFPVIVAPAIGFLVDWAGGRLYICGLAALTSIVGFAIFLGAHQDAESAVVAMLLLSISTSTTPTLVKSAVPLVVPNASLGTAFGIYSMFESLGGGVGHILFGIVRDYSESYQDDVKALVGLAGLALAVSAATLRLAPALNQPTAAMMVR